VNSQYSLPADGFVCSLKAEHTEGSGAGVQGPSVPSVMPLRAHVATGLSRKLLRVGNLAVRVKALREE